jgi:uncharacterized protein
MDKKEVVRLAAEYVKAALSGDCSGHDWWHVYRVWQLSKRIALEEKADVFAVELAALFHDISDYKLNGGDEKAALTLTRKWLQEHEVDALTIERVCTAIANIGFKSVERSPSLEAAIVRDADYLDAMGAVGIERAFTFGGYKGLPVHTPGIPPKDYHSREEYKGRSSSTINHFYEKLLRLKELMQTPTAKRMAEHRHKVMEEYLAEFKKEWDAKDAD